jgi:hypothetical protein
MPSSFLLPVKETEMPANEDYESLQSLAERLKLEGDDRENFVSSSMKRLGYKPATQWQEPEPEGNDNNDSGDFFSRKQKREQRRVQGGGGGGGNGGNNDSNNGSGWQYGGQ